MEEFKSQLEEVCESLRHRNGLYSASKSEHYKYCWPRDTYYQASIHLKSNPAKYIQTWETICEWWNGLNEKYDNKVDWLIKEGRKNVNHWAFIHARLNPKTLDEISEPWGNIQLDSLAYIMLGLVEGWAEGYEIEGSEKVCEDIVKILDSIEYWHCPDNGAWEENEEIHLSSIGAVVGALLQYRRFTDDFDGKISELVRLGDNVAKQLFPNESATKDSDLALLTLIYPFKYIDARSTEAWHILDKVYPLWGQYGLIRYKGDKYFESECGEMQWCFGFAFLGIINHLRGNKDSARHYLYKLMSIHKNNDDRGIPEGYICENGEFKPNSNNPLGWTTAMTINLINLISE